MRVFDRVPRFVGSFLAVLMPLMIQLRGVSNEKARKLLPWQPKYRNWRESSMETPLQPSA